MAHSPTARRFTFVLLDRSTMLPFAAGEIASAGDDQG